MSSSGLQRSAMEWRFNIILVLKQMRRPRTLAVLFAALALLIGWSLEGTRIISTLNPTLGRELAIAQHPPLDVWITSPDYAHAAPTIISTPAGVRYEHDTLTIPQGSVISAHLAEQDGDAPELVVDGDGTSFTTDTHGDYAATMPLTDGKKVSIRRGWLTLASWKIEVVPDYPPRVAMVEPPAVTDSKAVRLFYSATDAFGVTEVALRVTPHGSGADNTPIDLPLPITAGKQVGRIDFQDLTSYPFAGQKVTLQMVAINTAGKKSVSKPVEFTLPERRFFHPVARVLIEERKKLMQNPDNEKLRDETANIMAGIAHETGNYHGDPVVLMALRSGAVRLILDRDHRAVTSVKDILWQAATRIEDGNAGSAQQMLRDARQDLADALDRNAGQQEIDLLTKRLQQALGAYMSHLNMHTIPPSKNKGAALRAPLKAIAGQARLD